MEPKKLMALLRGELDWVVMKCLEKQRDRRYETANALGRDVQRYLADELVEARPPSAGYRLRKFAGRHRAALASTTAIAVLLVAGLSVSKWQMSRAIAAEGQAKENAQKAQEESAAKDVALQAEKMARADEKRARDQAFAALRSMTAGVVEKKFAQGTALTEDDRAFLHGIIAQFDAFAAIKGDDPGGRAARAEGRYRVGTMRHRLGELKQAEQDYDQALSVYLQLTAEFPNDPEFRQALAANHDHRGMLLSATGRLQKALKDYNQAVSIRQLLTADFPAQPEYRRDLAANHNNRGNLLHTLRRLSEAEQDFNVAVSINKQLLAAFANHAEFRQNLAVSHSNRGNLRSDKGQTKEAEQDYDQALEIQRQLVAEFPGRPEYRQELADSHNNRGILLQDSGQLQEAEKDYNQGLAIRKQLAAEFPAWPEYRRDLAASHTMRGTLLQDMGRLNEAEQDCAATLSIQRQLVAEFPSQPEYRQVLAAGHTHRGNLLRGMGRPKEAERDYTEALSIQRQLAADFHNQPEFRQDLATSLNNRGSLLSSTGQTKEAEQDYDQALGIRKQLVAAFPNQPDLQSDLAASCLNLALLHQRQGNLVAARRLLLDGGLHHRAALKANSGHSTYRQFYRKQLRALTTVYAGLLEQADAVRTAQTCRDLGWDTPGDAYDAACFLSQCIPIVAKHTKLDAKHRQEASQFYGDAAMKFLGEAVSKGFKDVPHLKQDSDLDPLRLRKDFQKLIADLEGKK
jgi:tetratricopeptide (TPR) repeat protein